jgi:hypothetical protein
VLWAEQLAAPSFFTEDYLLLESDRSRAQPVVFSEKS